MLRCTRMARASGRSMMTRMMRFSSEKQQPGFMDRMRNSLQERREEKQEKAFDTQIQAFLNVPAFTLDSFKKQLEDGIKEGGWRMKIPGENKKQLRAMEQQIEVLSHFTERERQNSTRINGMTKKRVAEKSGLAVKDINFLLKQFETMRSIHKWLKVRQTAGLSIPKSMDEATDMATRDPRGLQRPRFRQRG
eukprot:g1853.t1